MQRPVAPIARTPPGAAGEQKETPQSLSMRSSPSCPSPPKAPKTPFLAKSNTVPKGCENPAVPSPELRAERLRLAAGAVWRRQWCWLLAAPIPLPPPPRRNASPPSDDGGHAQGVQMHVDHLGCFTPRYRYCERRARSRT